MEVEMKIRGLMIDPVTNMPIVLLKESESETVLPIWVGVYEANAIALEIEKVSTPRPMTHDLLKNLLIGLETTVRKVVVTELRDDTFYAVIWLDRGGEIISVDSRPSDALALALRMDCPIYVEEEVLKSSKQPAEQAGGVNDRVSADDLRKWLENLGRRRPRPLQDVAMADPSEQLQRLYLAGFELQTFERYPNSVGVLRDGCIALLRATPAGLEMIGTPGWRMGEFMGVLVERDGRKVFQSKAEIVEATPERLGALRRFRNDVDELLKPVA